ncbi:two-component system sensor histidine kinase NtrB [Marinobacterium jannaschii]|uniref:two-component system sensor histidine kinase NtrB n=1 Tax=Marinobacterium jannaschii TaxID=64970 RepID=UPI00048184B6|nr:PAS domain S-box protein [Marinobacterium jannaschii]
MTKYLFACFALLQSDLLYAGINLFKDEHGKTNWQHLANWTSGTLIIILSLVVINLFFTRRKAHKANAELTEIRGQLEERVQERTETLDRSNKLLQESNQLLEKEIAQHVITTNRLRSSENYIRDILKSMPLMLIGLNEQGAITQWNKRAEEISNIKADDAIGKNLWKVLPTVTISQDKIKQVLASKEPISIRHSQHGLYHFEITVYPLREQDENGVVVLIDDVSKQTQTENLLINSDKMSSMSELAASMAHDISAPLQAILFDLQVFQTMLTKGSLLSGNNGDSEEMTKLGNLLSDAAEKGQDVAKIVANLLHFSRGRSDEKQSTDIVDLMDHTLEHANSVLSSPSGLRFKDIEIERHYQDDLPSIPCYVTELQQVFLSILRHSCEAIAQNDELGRRPLIRIQIAECYDALAIKIQHNGKGLTPDEQMYLFEPFFSSPDGVETYDAGKRLSFCHYIMTEQHQGHIAVTSDPDVGSTFHLQLELK